MKDIVLVEPDWSDVMTRMMIRDSTLVAYRALEINLTLESKEEGHEFAF